MEQLEFETLFSVVAVNIRYMRRALLFPLSGCVVNEMKCELVICLVDE